jgi:hypothetical protein
METDYYKLYTYITIFLQLKNHKHGDNAKLWGRIRQIYREENLHLIRVSSEK